MSIDDYLKSAEGVGHFDSAGTFTLDQNHALQKLRRYQIAQPAEFSLALVASAIASGAEWIDIRSSPSSFHLEHDGAPIPHHQLVSLFSSLLMSNSEGDLAAVQELAYGLNALLWLGPSRVHVTCRDEQQLSTLELGSRQLVVRKGEPLETYGKVARRTVIAIEGLWRGVPQIARRGMGKRPEIDCLRERCAHSEVSLLVDGQPLVHNAETARALCVATLGQPRSSPASWPAPLLRKTGPGDAVLAICPESPGRLTVVLHGVEFPVVEAELPGVQAVVFTSELRKDLSGSAIVQDAAYRRCLDELLAAHRQLVDLLGTHWNRLPASDRKMAAMVLEKEGQRARERWEVERAGELLQAARAVRRTDLRH